jgi:hypothetical protein
MYYQESKKINLNGFVAAYIITLISAVFLGFIYSTILLINILPVVNIFIAIGLGLTLGILNRFINRITHNRNKKSQLIQASIIAILVILFRWINHIVFYSENGLISFSYYITNSTLIFKPIIFVNQVRIIIKTGFEFYIFPAVLGEMTMNGFILSLIYIFEIIIVSILSIGAVFWTKIYPYSENLRKWYPKYTLTQDFESISTVNQLLVDMKGDALSAIQGLGKGIANRHSKIHLFFEKNEEKQYLTVEKIFIESNGKGKKRSKIIINNLIIDTKTATSIMDNFRHKRERTEII